MGNLPSFFDGIFELIGIIVGGVITIIIVVVVIV